MEVSIAASSYFARHTTLSNTNLMIIVTVNLFQVKMTMDGGDIKTEFTLEISVFKDEDYLLPYGIRDFPLKVSLSKPLFVQVIKQVRKINSPC